MMVVQKKNVRTARTDGHEEEKHGSNEPPRVRTVRTAAEVREARLFALEDFKVGLSGNKRPRASKIDRKVKKKNKRSAPEQQFVIKGVAKDTNVVPRYTAKKINIEDKRNERADDAEKRRRGLREKKVDANRKKEKKEPAPEKVVREEVARNAKVNGGLDISDLTFEELEALKEYGGLTGNMTREQVDEIINRASPLTEGGRPFVISTPIPTGRFLNPRRLTVNDVATGKKIVI